MNSGLIFIGMDVDLNVFIQEINFSKFSIIGMYYTTTITGKNKICCQLFELSTSQPPSWFNQNLSLDEIASSVNVQNIFLSPLKDNKLSVNFRNIFLNFKSTHRPFNSLVKVLNKKLKNLKKLSTLHKVSDENNISKIIEISTMNVEKDHEKDCKNVENVEKVENKDINKINRNVKYIDINMLKKNRTFENPLFDIFDNLKITKPIYPKMHTCIFAPVRVYYTTTNMSNATNNGHNISKLNSKTIFNWLKLYINNYLKYLEQKLARISIKTSKKRVKNVNRCMMNGDMDNNYEKMCLLVKDVILKMLPQNFPVVVDLNNLILKYNKLTDHKLNYVKGEYSFPMVGIVTSNMGTNISLQMKNGRCEVLTSRNPIIDKFTKEELVEILETLDVIEEKNYEDLKTEITLRIISLSEIQNTK